MSGTSIFRGALSLPATGTATAAAGTNSQPLNFTASSFNSSTLKAVNETFRWQGEPVSNNSATPLGKLSLLFGAGIAAPTETGLSISSKGQITFASGQTFPSTLGSVKSVGLSAPASDFSVSGSPVTGSGTLGLNWKVAPTSGNIANAIVKRDASGSLSAGAITASLGVTGISAGSATAGVSGQNTSSGYGLYGVASGTTGQGVWGESFGTDNSNGAGPDGVHGVTHSNAGSGVAGLSSGATGIGVYGQGGGYGVYGVAASNGRRLATGTGVYGSSALGTGVYGSSPGGFGFATDGNAQQVRTAGGWVKAMVHWDGESTGTMLGCFNSSLAGAPPPCLAVLAFNRLM